MTKRYFITDALQSAIAARYFTGFLFCREDGSFLFYNDILAWVNGWIRLDKAYLHPDSEHLLQPQDDDLGIDAHGKTAWFYPDSNGGGEWVPHNEAKGIDEETLAIILRNNKPFPQVESEEV